MSIKIDQLALLDREAASDLAEACRRYGAELAQARLDETFEEVIVRLKQQGEFVALVLDQQGQPAGLFNPEAALGRVARRMAEKDAVSESIVEALAGLALGKALRSDTHYHRWFCPEGKHSWHRPRCDRHDCDCLPA